MVSAIEKGYPQREIAASAYRFQRQLEAGERVMVGVNKYAAADLRGRGPRDTHIPTPPHRRDGAADPGGEPSRR